MQPPDNNYEIWENEFNRYFITEWLVSEKKKKQYVISIATNCSIYKKSMTKENTVKIYKINNKKCLGNSNM